LCQQPSISPNMKNMKKTTLLVNKRRVPKNEVWRMRSTPHQHSSTDVILLVSAIVELLLHTIPGEQSTTDAAALADADHRSRVQASARNNLTHTTSTPSSHIVNGLRTRLGLSIKEIKLSAMQFRF
jgi:hypothetical protein